MHTQSCPDQSVQAGEWAIEELEALSRFASLTRLSGMHVKEARKINDREAVIMFGPVEPVLSVEETEIEEGLRARVYVPGPAPNLPVLVYFHGGGWVVGSLDSHDGVARFLCRFAPCVVISVAYRLAPEHKFPAALEDAWLSTNWAVRRAVDAGWDPNRLAV